MARKTVRCVLTLMCAATAPCFLTAQQAAHQPAPQTALESALERLGEQAMLLQRSLPSLTCTESVISQEFRHKLVARSVDFTASLRAVRGDDGDIRESYEFKTLRGQPFTGGGFVMPIYVAGGFTRSLRYFVPDQQLATSTSSPAADSTLRPHRICRRAAAPAASPALPCSTTTATSPTWSAASPAATPRSTIWCPSPCSTSLRCP